jgi:anti-sigma B factor antagonist
VDELASVVVHRRDSVCVATITGEIDVSNVDEVASRLEGQLAEDAPVQVIDLTGTSYLDSAGLRLLYVIADRLRARRRTLHLVVPEHAPILRLLELVDLPRHVEMHTRIADVPGMPGRTG